MKPAIFRHVLIAYSRSLCSAPIHAAEIPQPLGKPGFSGLNASVTPTPTGWKVSAAVIMTCPSGQTIGGLSNNKEYGAAEDSLGASEMPQRAPNLEVNEQTFYIEFEVSKTEKLFSAN